jgi:hypothetical protein
MESQNLPRRHRGTEKIRIFKNMILDLTCSNSALCLVSTAVNQFGIAGNSWRIGVRA